MDFSIHASPMQQVHSSLFPGIELWVKRDDLLHKQVSGNKFRKLKYPLLQAQKSHASVVSMGGAWSNHLHALAHAASLCEIPSYGIVRGLRNTEAALTATLNDCRSLGMQLDFVSRDVYRALREHEYAQTYMHKLGLQDAMWLPEGGSSVDAMKGVAELVDELPFMPDLIMTPCGTGTTLAGILAGLRGRAQVIGIAAVQNAGYLASDILRLLDQAGLPSYQNFDILLDHTIGGFAKTSPELDRFCTIFFEQTEIMVEPIYTGKMFYALHQLCERGHFSVDTCIVAIHTGGIQGLRGFL